MPDTAHDYYAALCARDRRFDGRFFVGVSTTGIYCRPICAVRTPRFEHCRFFPSAAAAEAQGFRPCLRCRPELAPGLAAIDAADRYATAAARLIEQGFLAGHSCADLAHRMGITDRHLRRVFAGRYGVSPVAFAQSQRLLLAKRLLAETDLPVTEIALAAGFGSLRRFNELVRSRYRLSPSALRHAGPATEGRDICLRLAYRPPLDWDALLGWLAPRAIAGVEAVDREAGEYRRTLALAQGARRLDGWVRVRADGDRPVLRVTPSASLLPALPQLLSRLRRLFDLDASPRDIADALGELAAPRPGLRLPGALSGFEGAVRAVLEQPAGRVATHLPARLAERYGEPVTTPWATLDRLFPGPEILARAAVEEIAGIGIPRRRAQAVQQLARRSLDGTLALDEVVDIHQGLARLQAIPGIGPWTAGCIAMRAWSWPDVFLPTDPVVRRRLGGGPPRTLAARAQHWSPWRSYAVLHLWAADTPDQQ